ncbi:MULTISPECIES: T9SS type B sorting domain-containing protein [Chryseobacterium]|uniref:Gliding motility-associated-like protein n=1 Tax=Chryseobacterium geocarposphaerae TaxID=1416776 RepID=A0ABU1LGD0_9FLAO|nr:MULTISPECIES: T9SS type B sorting domain-containing protein [Chryseobacterium]MDR6405754.1 gliding motility-associated-like protein [Chryseobacterium geocarposphaerae]MDR6699083.1 gliding motility-associated-like protein [Chryseobacterium ginsenosidimutans]
MKRFLLSLVLVFLTINTLFAQRDTEHWFAPMMNRTGLTGGTNSQSIYFSTDSTTPFEVTIYNNNNPIGTVTISKGDPKVYVVPVGNIITTSQADLFTPITKGLYTKGPKPYYANLRFSIPSHGEILTSKGKAGIGKKFYAAAAPITDLGGGGIYNFMAGILATEDNTVVTVSGYSSGVIFSNGTTGATTPSMSFTLNKGQSYIIEGRGNQTANATGFIGAKIESDKPISLTNGNFNGQFSWGAVGGSSDIIMDQSVPVDRLGNEFVLVKGNGNVTALMEDALIIATENNTEIQINGGPVVATLNEGQFYRVNGPNAATPANNVNYIDQGNGHYNMYIKTSKNVYVYQLLAGLATSIATLGYNYIPPLNCFLPRKIEEIAFINDLNGSLSPDIKLNILTEAGAAVSYSVGAGPVTTPTAAQGPYPVTGTTAWVSYSIPGLSGNVTVNSTKAVTAGIAGGSGAVGYGGYFAGFSSIPVIAKQSGDCVPGIVLEVDDSFETYQWFLNGVAISGATLATYTPTQAGNYTVKVTMGTCPPVTTPVYKVFSCIRNTTANLNACATKVITPTFSFTTSQVPVASTVTILTYPTHGTATLNTSTGQITYIPNPGYLGADQIVYQFCGNAAEFIDCEHVTLNLNVVPFILQDVTIKACQYDGKGFFDLTTAPVTLLNPVVKKFYPTLADLNAGTNMITNPTNYLSAAGAVYVLVTTSEGCTGSAKITLEFLPTPVVNEATLSECFLENDEARAKFNLTIAVVSSETPITKKYYPTFVDASNGTNEILIANEYISGNGAAYVRVYNSQGCYAIAKVNLKVIPPKRSPLLVDKTICIDARTNLDAGPGYASYEWNTGATTQVLPGATVGEYWVILEDNGCFVKQFVSVKKATDPVITELEISNNTVTVHVSGGQGPYQYAVDSPTNWQDSNVFTGLSRGQHTFYVRDAYNCTPISVEITVPNLINTITPNGDNKNDFIDYSELAYKDNLSFVIYDRYGNKIFTGDKFNNYKWDGKHYDKKLVTGTYWYHINWNEPNKAKTPIKYTGWILVKNID